MKQKTITVGSVEVANDKPFTLFGGMNVLESRDMAMRIAEKYVEVTQKLGIPYVFKASFDKVFISSTFSTMQNVIDSQPKPLIKVLSCLILPW